MLQVEGIRCPPPHVGFNSVDKSLVEAQLEVWVVRPLRAREVDQVSQKGVRLDHIEVQAVVGVVLLERLGELFLRDPAERVNAAKQNMWGGGKGKILANDEETRRNASKSIMKSSRYLNP